MFIKEVKFMDTQFGNECDICSRETDDLYECDICGAEACGDCHDFAADGKRLICLHCQDVFESGYPVCRFCDGTGASRNGSRPDDFGQVLICPQCGGAGYVQD